MSVNFRCGCNRVVVNSHTRGQIPPRWIAECITPRGPPMLPQASPFTGTSLPLRSRIPGWWYTAQSRSFTAGRITPKVCVRPPPETPAPLPSYFQSSEFRNTTSTRRITNCKAGFMVLDPQDNARRYTSQRDRNGTGWATRAGWPCFPGSLPDAVEAMPRAASGPESVSAPSPCAGASSVDLNHRALFRSH